MTAGGSGRRSVRIAPRASESDPAVQKVMAIIRKDPGRTRKLLHDGKEYYPLEKYSMPEKK